MIIDGGHLAAVLCGVGPSGVEDQDVGRLSELSSVLQVPFSEREKNTQLLIHTHGMTSQFRKQNPMPSSFEVPFIG